MPEWIPTVVEQLWSFLAVSLAVYALGSTSKRIADRFGWRRARSSDVRKLVKRARAGVDLAEDSGGVALPSDASWYDITLRLHPLLAGALFGFLPLPALNVITEIAKDPEAGLGALLAARCAWFMLAGALSGQVYEAVKYAFTEGRVRLLAMIGRSPEPAPPAVVKTDDGEAISTENER